MLSDPRCTQVRSACSQGAIEYGLAVRRTAGALQIVAAMLCD